jgi:hypothetical protein
MSYKTVIAPKVVMQTSPAQRIVWIVLLIAAFLLAIWFSYDYGRMQTSASGPHGRLIAQLEQERDTMQQRIEQLESEIRSGRTDRETGTARAIVRALEGNRETPAEPAPEDAPSADKPAEKPAATKPATEKKPADKKPAAGAPSNQLQLENVRIEASDGRSRFRFRFSVVLPGSDAGQVVGTIWIAVNGTRNGNPVRLSLKQISSQERPYLDMRFEGRQDVEAELTLPADFDPKNIAIEAKPYDKKFRGASGKFDWEKTNRA